MSIKIDQISQADTKIKDENKPSSILNLLNKDISFKKKFKDKKKERFYTELGILLTAGIDIKTTLEIASEEQEKKVEKEILQTIKDNVIAGGSLSESIKKTGHFSEYEYYTIKIGEESGKLAKVLENLSNYYTKKIEQKRKLISTFSYPLMVLLMAVLAIYFMLTFIVPMFEEVFKRFDGELPALTQAIISLSELFADYAFLFFLSLTLSIIFLYSQRKKNWFRKVSASITLKIPLIGDLVNKIFLARLCHSLHFLIGSKNPLLKSLQLVRKMIRFYPYEKALEQIEDDILHGINLSQSLEKFPLFNRKMVYLIKVAEEVNKLDLIFDQLNKQLSEEVEYKMNSLGSLLEPFLILFIGFFVAIILIAMYLPLFQLSTSIF